MIARRIKKAIHCIVKKCTDNFSSVGPILCFFLIVCSSFSHNPFMLHEKKSSRALCLELKVANSCLRRHSKTTFNLFVLKMCFDSQTQGGSYCNNHRGHNLRSFMCLVKIIYVFQYLFCMINALVKYIEMSNTVLLTRSLVTVK